MPILQNQCKAGVSNKFKPWGHKRHTMMSCRPGRPTESNRLPWLGNREFTAYKMH